MKKIAVTFLGGLMLSVLCVAVLAGCAAPLDIPQHGAPMAAPSESQEYRISDDGTYIEGYLLLTGASEDIARLLDPEDPMRQELVNLELVDSGTPALSLTELGIDGDLQIKLIRHGNRSSPQALAAVYDVLTRTLAGDLGSPLTAPLFADLLAVTTPPEVGGSGNSVGAHPFGPATPISATGIITSQWALSASGIGLYDADGRTVTQTGNGVQIVVFDTSPYTLSGAGPELQELPSTASPQGVAKSFHVYHPFNVTYTPKPTTTVNMSSHGIFVLGLVHAVAPDADLKLVRVLDEDGYGDLYTMVAAILSETPRDRTSQTVFNLSLGTRETDLSEDTVNLIRDYCAAVRDSSSFTGNPATPSDSACSGNHPQFSLETVMKIVDEKQVIVVAAAGNDSADMATPMPATNPADFAARIGHLLGVASSGKTVRGPVFPTRGRSLLLVAMQQPPLARVTL
ncbi:MAG: S8 family serine peptidase [Caldilineaceae bacterium]